MEEAFVNFIGPAPTGTKWAKINDTWMQLRKLFHFLLGGIPWDVSGENVGNQPYHWHVFSHISEFPEDVDFEVFAFKSSILITSSLPGMTSNVESVMSRG